MMHDVAIVGAGPVGGTLALALADADLDVVALDARAEGATLRRDRSLALSHGARLVFERLGVWSRLADAQGALSPILAIDISQAGGFGVTRLAADEQGLPALGYVVSYVALQAAIDAELARTRTAIRYGAQVAHVGGTPSHAAVTFADAGHDALTARLAVVADGTGTAVAGIARERREYGQVALLAKIAMASPHQGVAYERFTPSGPVALLPEGDHYGLIWTMAPAEGERTLALSDAQFLAELAAHFGARVDGFRGVRDRTTFPLALEFARPAVTTRCVLIGNAAQTLHPVAGQGFNLGVRDAYALARTIVEHDHDALGDRAMVADYAARRRVDRVAGIAFTHGLTQLFAPDWPPLSWPRGVALSLLDAVPPLKRAFTSAMLFGLR
ncbi:MAG: FAD-dependent monooxygenase [Burkholderiales bacterium]|nr:FAD-dependent monooxygenase [Burkholderiales bacterium]